MYLRFVCSGNIEGMDACAGIFRAVYDLRRRSDLDQITHEQLEEMLEWFHVNLTIPQSFTRSGAKRGARETTRGLSWFKQDACDMIERVWELKALLELWDYFVEVLRTDRPGYAIHEDDVQVVADPFVDTPR